MKDKKREYDYNIDMIKKFMKGNSYDNKTFACKCRISEEELTKILKNDIHVPLICFIRISGFMGVPYEKLFIINNL